MWRWAGVFRTTERNIGVEPWRIRPELRQLLDDARFWVDQASYAPDELAVRFHHRLVAIHLFPNGNGRHARMMADLLITRLGGRAFPWGRASLATAGDVLTSWFGIVILGAGAVSGWGGIALARTRAHRPRWPWEDPDDE